MKKVFVNARKSTESEDRQALSIPSQIAELTEFATRFGFEINAIYEEAHSAKKPGRPEFNEMLKDVKALGGGVRILCWKLDRLALNLQDAALLPSLCSMERSPKS